MKRGNSRLLLNMEEMNQVTGGVILEQNHSKLKLQKISSYLMD